MNTHIKIVAALRIPFGFLFFIGIVALFAVLGLADGIASAHGQHQVAGILDIVAPQA
jgi:hypothetical protein